MATTKRAAKKAPAKKATTPRRRVSDKQPATPDVVPTPEPVEVAGVADDMAAVDIRPCPRCETTDRVTEAGGNPPMLVHWGCGYTFPVEPDDVV